MTDLDNSIDRPPLGDGSAVSPAVDPLPAPLKANPREIGGRNGPDPTRFGDWELRGRCIDF